MMTAPQIIRTPSGEELVVIPRAEYEALVAAVADAEEDVADAAIYDARKKDLAQGRDIALPVEVSQSILRGDSLLKALRKWRNLTQIELAQATGLGQGYISDLESQRRGGTTETLNAIAKALDVDPSWLVRE
ncbi:MAG TPA: helix-turn-helix transcriptional regulator [Beijerinckia sp.]|jgi:hypothetical protein|nr:helix-turn-helix transcriptional regulator [Beijerinckia sp.]